MSKPISEWYPELVAANVFLFLYFIYIRINIILVGPQRVWTLRGKIVHVNTVPRRYTEWAIAAPLFSVTHIPFEYSIYYNSKTWYINFETNL
jgi:hypothetical protein